MADIIEFPRLKSEEDPREFSIHFYQAGPNQCGFEVDGIEITDPDTLRSVAGFLESLADIFRADADEL